MKKILFLALLLVNINYLSAQSTTDYTLIANYPLQSDGVDATGNNPDMIITNASFQNGGIYSNGIYYGTNQTEGSFIKTPKINTLDINNFILQLDFNVETTGRPILICGALWRWLTVGTDNDGKFYYEINFANSQFYSQTTDYSITTGTWYTLGIKLDQNSSKIKIFINDELVDTYQFTQNIYDNGDYVFTDEHGGSGVTFKGYWRNLKIYKLVTGINDFKVNEISVYPNPGHNVVTVNSTNKSISRIILTDISGKIVLSDKVNRSSYTLTELKPGIYFLKVELYSGENKLKKIIIN